MRAPLPGRNQSGAGGASLDLEARIPLLDHADLVTADWHRSGPHKALGRRKRYGLPTCRCHEDWWALATIRDWGERVPGTCRSCAGLRLVEFAPAVPVFWAFSFQGFRWFPLGGRGLGSYRGGMAVRVARGTIGYLRKHRGNLYLQVRSADHDRAVAAVRAAVAEIWEIRSTVGPEDPAASFISGVMRLPDGPAISIDLKDEPEAVRRAVVDALVRQATAAGIEQGEVGPPPSRPDAPFLAGPLPWTLRAGVRYPSLSLRSRKPPRGPGFRRPPIPASWGAPLCDWVLRDVDEDEEVWVGIAGIAFKAPASVARTMLDPPVGGIVNLAAGNGALRMLHYSWGGLSYQAKLATWGEDVQDEDAAAVVAEFQQVARRVAADIDYAKIDYWEPEGRPEWRPSGAIDISPDHPAYTVADAFWWQILSPHGAFTISDDDPPGLPLPGGRRELAFGTFDDWREPEPPSAQRRDEALRVMEPLIASLHYIRVTADPDQARDEIVAKLSELLPGGTWTSPSRYQVIGADHAVDVELDREGMTIWPAGRTGIALARAASATFQGRVVEHNPHQR